MSYCRRRLSLPTASITSSAAREVATKKPGVSRVLSGSSTSSMPARAVAAAAKRRFSTRVSRALLVSDFDRRNAGQAIEPAAAQQPCVFDGEADAILKFGDAPRMAGNAAIAGGPVARRQVEQHDFLARGQHHLGQRRAVSS